VGTGRSESWRSERLVRIASSASINRAVRQQRARACAQPVVAAPHASEERFDIFRASTSN
jgi:hypothetical protein